MVWSPSGAAVYIHHECDLLQVSTRPDMTVEVSRTPTSNQPIFPMSSFPQDNAILAATVVFPVSVPLDKRFTPYYGMGEEQHYIKSGESEGK